MWRRALQFLPLLAMTFAASVGAATIQITVTGTVIDSDNGGGLFTGFAPGPGTLNGQSATLTFWYDTVGAPSDSYSGPDPPINALYERKGWVSGYDSNPAVGDVSWIRSSATIGGIAVPYYAGASGNYYNQDLVDIHNGLPGPAGESDRLYVLEYAFDADDYVTFPAESVSDYNSFSISSTTVDFLSGTSLDQTFALNGSGWAYLQRARDRRECAQCDLISYSAFAKIEISSISVTQVAEPSTLALLGLGLAGLAASRRRRWKSAANVATPLGPVKTLPKEKSHSHSARSLSTKQPLRTFRDRQWHKFLSSHHSRWGSPFFR